MARQCLSYDSISKLYLYIYHFLNRFSSTEEESKIGERLKITESKYRSKLKRQLRKDISKLREQKEGLRKQNEESRSHLKSNLELIERSSQQLLSAYKTSDEWFGSYGDKIDNVAALKSHVPETSSQMELSDTE